MSLIDKIEDLRKKPEPVRYRVLIISLIIIMSVIIFFWITLFKYSLKNSEIVGKDNSLKPLKTVSAMISDFSRVFKNNFSKVKENIKNIQK
jgi:ABC-type sugar transport system permease subunit